MDKELKFNRNKKNQEIHKKRRKMKKENIPNKKSNVKIKVHDSIIKELLEDKEEFRDYMREFLGYDFRREDLQLQNKEYRLKKSLITKYIDILYKIKDEETFIILEHQSTIDYKMSERISEECLAVVESRNSYMKRSKNRRAPVILANVLCTANKIWNATTTLIENEKNYYKFPKQKYPKYIVTNNYDYKVDDLIVKRTGIAVVMAFEKVETKKDIDYIINKLKQIGEVNEREKKAMRLIINNIEQVMPKLMKTLTGDEIEKIKKGMKKIIEGEGDFMSNFEKAIAKIIRENEEAEAKGRADTIFQAVKKMLNKNMKDEDIMDCMDITKEELEKLKLQMT